MFKIQFYSNYEDKTIVVFIDYLYVSVAYPLPNTLVNEIITL